MARKIRTHHKGYKLVYMPDNPMSWHDGYVPVHRLVMSEVLGRSLTIDEHVHHIDGNKDNNDPKNLLLTNASEHRRIHNFEDMVYECKEPKGKIKNLYLMGYSVRDIAKMTSISKSTVQYHIKKMGISRPNMITRDENGRFRKVMNN